MPYKTGSWGIQAKERSKKRLTYFKEKIEERDYYYIKKGRLKTHWWRTGGEFKKSFTSWNKDKHIWEDRPHPRGMLGKIPWNKGIKRTDIAGEKHPNWKGGISKTREWRLERNKIWRKNHREYIRLRNKLRRHRMRGGGILTKETLQLVYEDNIKKFGTLTCYLCLEPIKFGKDSLEHKIPLSRGGTNAYENLAVAHRSCNAGKRDKTTEEFLKFKKRREEENGKR